MVQQSNRFFKQTISANTQMAGKKEEKKEKIYVLNITRIK